MATHKLSFRQLTARYRTGHKARRETEQRHGSFCDSGAAKDSTHRWGYELITLAAAPASALA